MLQWEEFSAWISIEGRELEEYEEYGVEADKDKRTVTCWIASELGKKFSVRWSNTSYIQDTRGGNVPKTRNVDGVRSGDGISVKPFMVSSLEIIDDDTILSGPSYAELGVIKLEIRPVRITDRRAPRSGASRFLSDLKVPKTADLHSTIRWSGCKAVFQSGFSVSCFVTGV